MFSQAAIFFREDSVVDGPLILTLINDKKHIELNEFLHLLK